MRLIDADALREALFVLPIPGSTIIAILDAAPTVSCGNVIDVRPNGRYLTNVHPVVLNVVEDGYVEYLNLNLGEFSIERRQP
jgi:hypothetical protein